MFPLAFMIFIYLPPEVKRKMFHIKKKMKESEKKATSEICHNFYTSNKNNFGCVRNKKIKNTKFTSSNSILFKIFSKNYMKLSKTKHPNLLHHFFPIILLKALIPQIIPLSTSRKALVNRVNRLIFECNWAPQAIIEDEWWCKSQNTAWTILDLVFRENIDAFDEHLREYSE